MIVVVLCDRGLDLIAHEEGVSKDQAAANRHMCTSPSAGTSLPLPHVASSAKDFDDYNKDVLAIFTAHAAKCLYCREKNHTAVENLHHAAVLFHHGRLADEEDEERHREEEAERRKRDEERLQHVLEYEEEHRIAEEEDFAHHQAEEEARRKHDEDVEALEYAAKKRIREAEEVAEQQHAEIESSLKTLKAKRDKALAAAVAAAECVTKRHEMEKEHLLEEKKLKEEKLKLQERLFRQKEEDEDMEMMKLLKKEEADRRREAERVAREKRTAALKRRTFLRKHDGVLASSQSGAVYEDKKADAKAIDDIAHMSLAHAKQEHLIHPHHTIGGETFHKSHSRDSDDV